MATLVPVLTGGNGTPTYNLGMAETYSWIPIANDQNRPMFARANYITNLSDLTVSISAGSFDIGAVHLLDKLNGNYATITQVGLDDQSRPIGAVNVLINDLTSTLDSIAIGDKTGNPVTVNSSYSALNVYNVKPTTAVQVLNPISAVSLTNQITSVSVTNFPTQLTAVSVTNFPTQLTAVSLTNQITSVSITNFPTQLTAVSVTNQLTGVTVLNTVSAVSVTNFPTQLTAVSVTNQLTGITVLNPVTSLSAYITNPQIEITNDVGNPIPISTTQVLPISGNVTISNAVSAIIVPNNNADPVLTKFTDSLQLDSLGRLRTANTTNQWWYQASVDKDGDLRFTEQFTALSAQSIYVPGIAAVMLTPGLSSTGSAIRQTRRYFKHRPGVGHQVFFTLNWSGTQTGTVKRIGQYDSTDGMYFELSGTNFNVVVRRTIPDGTMVEDRTNSANFSNDKLDGTGPSGLNFFTPAVTAVNLSAVSVTTVTQTNYPNVYNVVFDTNGVDLTSTYKVGSKISVSGASNNLYNGIVFVAATSTTQLTGTYTINPGTLPTGRTITASQTPWNMEWTFWFDYIGGRTSRVRFVIASPSQGPVLLHTYSSGGTLGTQFVNDTASPLRYEIFNTQTQTVLPVLTLGAEAIDIEAESSQNPNFTSAFNNTGVAFNKTTGTERPLIGVGLRAGQPYQRGDIQFQTINFTENGNNLNNAVNPFPTYYWRLVLNPTITGTITATNVGKTSQANTYAANATLSGGQQLFSGYFAGGVGAIEVPTSLNFLNMGTNVSNTTPDIVVLCATLIGDAPQNNSTLFAGVNFIEAL